MATDPTPFQSLPTLKNAAGLSNAHEYAGIWTGQSNSRPTGYPANGLEYAPELALEDTGMDLTSIVVPSLATRAVGMVERVTVDSTVDIARWNTGTYIRFGTKTVPEPGYAKVEKGVVGGFLWVRWISLPTDGYTGDGYLVREDSAKFYAYENVRVLTPYTPLQDIIYPIVAGDPWFPATHAPYPAANALMSSEGRRLLLPTPYNGATSVAAFDDLAVFLPLTRREGADGYGISEVADSSFTGVGNPTGHPITDITGQVFTFANSIPAGADLTNAYILVDWEQGGVSKRSWSRVASNTTTTFTATGTWLGDGIPIHPPEESTAVTFTAAAPGVVNWAGHGLVEGDRVTFPSTTGALPAEIVIGRVYRVRNPGAGTFQISESMDHPVLSFAGAGSGNATGIQAWIYTVWIPYWKDNPFTWLPGPEFAYPNENQQPLGPFLHFRARGQVIYAGNYPAAGGSSYLDPFDGDTDYRFGAMLPFAWRVSTATGKRMNMVVLGINGAPLHTSSQLNTTGYQGIAGWWNYEKFGFGLPLEDTTSQLADRLKRLITFIAPQALLAESSAKTMRYISTCHVQGETDALTEGGRETYIASITDYKRWIRDLIDSVSLSPFSGDAKVPFVQPLLTREPWENGSAFQLFGVDYYSDTNNGIRVSHVSDEYADYTLTDDIPKLVLLNGSVNTAHFSGEGQSVQGARLAAAVLDILDYALASTSSALATNVRLLRIANQALLYLGQSSTIIAALTENNTPARLVNQMLPEAIKQLLSMRQWSWATRIEPATQVKHDNPRWQYAYVVPGRAHTVVEIIPPTTEGNVSGVNQATTIPTPLLVSISFPFGELPQQITGNPAEFELGRSPSGHRLLFTNVAQLSGDISAGTITDGTLHPERLPRRPTLRYIDKVLDPDRFSDAFSDALAWWLASMLASGLVKGQQGAVVKEDMRREAFRAMGAEAEHESASRHQPLEHRPDWIAGR